MSARVFEGSSGVWGATLGGLAGAIGALLGGLFAMQRFGWPPAAFVAVLALAVVVLIIVVRAIGTDATFAIEPDALVRRTRRSINRVPWDEVLELRHSAPSELTPGGRIWVLLRGGATVTIHARTRDQGAELEGFFMAMREHVPGAR
jgi:hypothetical protein